MTEGGNSFQRASFIVRRAQVVSAMTPTPLVAMLDGEQHHVDNSMNQVFDLITIDTNNSPPIFT